MLTRDIQRKEIEGFELLLSASQTIQTAQQESKQASMICSASLKTWWTGKRSRRNCRTFSPAFSPGPGWQRQQGEVVLNNEGMGDVPSGGVQQNDSVYAGGDRLADFLEQKAHCSLIQYICQGFVRIVRNA